MNSARLSARDRAVLLAVGMAACHLLFPRLTPAQGGTSDTVGSRTTISTIDVFVQNAANQPISGSALVKLFSSDGTPIGQVSASAAGQVTFRNLIPGSYSVEVEAQGYLKAHTDVRLAVPGELRVDIRLQPDPKADSGAKVGAGMPVLTPNAKKELEDGLEALHRKDLDEAQKHFEKAVQLVPAHPEALYLLGTLYVQKNDSARATELFQEAVQIYPQHAKAQAALGILLANERKCDAALEPLQKALELSAQAWEARWALARCHYRLGKFEAALAESRQALHDSNGGAPDIVLVVAASLSAQGQIEESAATLREFLAKHPDHPEAARARRWLDRLEQTAKVKPN
jgi:TolA-binding protein